MQIEYHAYNPKAYTKPLSHHAPLNNSMQVNKILLIGSPHAGQYSSQTACDCKFCLSSIFLSLILNPGHS